MSADLLGRLIACGTPADLIGEVAMALARGETDRQAIASRRAADRDRQRSRRALRDVRGSHAESRGVTDRHVASRDGADASPSDKKNPPDPLKELTPTHPPEEAEASSAPDGGRAAGRAVRRSRRDTARGAASRIAADWAAPPVEALPPMVQAIVRQWPKGAYDLAALNFVNHWLAEGRALGAKRDWPRTWSNWLVRESAHILRAAKAGVRFDTVASDATGPPANPADRAEALDRSAALMERMGRTDDAAELRGTAARLRGEGGTEPGG
jgi:hypothetical protein